MKNLSETATPKPAVLKVEPFIFQTSMILQAATGLRAATLAQLVALLHEVPEDCIYHHTHQFLFTRQYLSPGPTNDFAYWVTEVLGEAQLGEYLAGIDAMAYSDLAALRAAFIDVMSRYLEESPFARLRFVSQGEEFFFNRSIHIVMPTPYTASTLEAFAGALEKVSQNVLSFHMFEARLRLKKPTNDFSTWLDEQMGLKALAERIAQLDPYNHTLETLRAELLALIHSALKEKAATHV